MKAILAKGFFRSTVAFLVAVVLALVVGAVALKLSGEPVLKVYGIMFTGAVGSSTGWAGVLVFAAPVAFTSLAALVAFKMQVWNIGGGGQLIMGACGATLVALTFGHVPGPLLLVLVVLGGALAGGLYAVVCAGLRLWLGVNEMLSTLMLNYVAVLFVDYLIFGPWKDPTMRGWPYSRPFPPGAMFPSIGGTGVHLGLLLAVVAGVLVHFVFRNSKWGFQVRVIGSSPSAARYAGMAIGPNVVVAMLLSGALAGLAGVGEVAGISGRLYHLTPAYGYSGILVAWLSGLDPLASLFFSLFYGVLLQGGSALKMAEVEPSLVLIIQAAVVIFTLAALTVANRPWRILPRQASPDQSAPGTAKAGM